MKEKIEKRVNRKLAKCNDVMRRLVSLMLNTLPENDDRDEAICWAEELHSEAAQLVTLLAEDLREK